MDSGHQLCLATLAVQMSPAVCPTLLVALPVGSALGRAISLLGSRLASGVLCMILPVLVSKRVQLFCGLCYVPIHLPFSILYRYFDGSGQHDRTQRGEAWGLRLA